MRAIVWSDDQAGAPDADVLRVHPEGVAATLAGIMTERSGVDTVVTGLHEAGDGLSEERLASADVLVWWAHQHHDAVSDATVDRVQRHVSAGLGLVVLHSAHHSKIFRRLMGTSCDLSWREADDEELIWTVDPAHPIAAGIDQPIHVGSHEVYGEYFDIPAPDRLVFISTFTGGEVFRSGCCFQRGAGRVFYFSAGHETHPVYAHPQVRRVIVNGVAWAAASGPRTRPSPAAEIAPQWGPP